jgi:hypothetical protein
MVLDHVRRLPPVTGAGFQSSVTLFLCFLFLDEAIYWALTIGSRQIKGQSVPSLKKIQGFLFNQPCLNVELAE